MKNVGISGQMEGVGGQIVIHSMLSYLAFLLGNYQQS